MKKVAIYGPTLTSQGLKKKGVLIEDGVITQVSNKELSDDLGDCLRLRAYQILLPGIVNWHEHGRDMKQANRETIATCTLHALMTGKFETWLMPNTNPPLNCMDHIRMYQAIIDKNALIPAYIHALIGPHTKKPTIDSMIAAGITHFKVFVGTTTDMDEMAFGEHNKKRLVEIIDFLPEGVEVSAHLELGLKEYAHLWNPAIPATHYDARPNQVELRAAEFFINKVVSEYPDIEFWACHPSTKEILELSRPQNFHLEFTPHYAYFNKEAFEWKRYTIKCNPSIKTEADRSALEQALYAGVFERWGDDHAPHTIIDKQENFYSGLPSFSGALLGYFILSASRPENLLKTFTKPEWLIQPGNPARLMILDTRFRAVREGDMATKARKISPYLNEELPFIKTIIYGKKII